MLQTLIDDVQGLLRWATSSREPEGMAFDRRWGTATRQFDLGNYEPSLPSVVEEALDALDVGPPGWTFVDLGCGKGRVCLLASQRPFERVVGIERRAGLHRTAVANLGRFADRGGPRCPVTLLHGDVTAHPLPEGPLVLYLYNPFPADVAATVLARAGVRPLRVIYVNPLETLFGIRVLRWGGQGFWRWQVLG